MVEYFSGLDVAVSGIVTRDGASGKFVPLDCHSIQFSYENPKSPIYTPGSELMTTKMQGTVVISGILSLNLSYPQNIKEAVGNKYANSGFYFDVDIKSERIEGGKKIKLTFEDAFIEARETVGPGKTFRFNGKTYSTNTKQETVGASNVSWGQFMTGDTLDLKIDFSNSSKNATSEAELLFNTYQGTSNRVGLYIRDVQITNRMQNVTPSPDNILENYQFIARNIQQF
tara:strand:- start:201 stop:884 length:684 start_codon:yes stop_codon:yes gene_type:complete